MKLTKSQLKQIIKEELETILDEGWFSAEPPPAVQGDEDLGWIFAEHKLNAKNLNHPLAKIFLNADKSLIENYAGLTRQVGGARVTEKKEGLGFGEGEPAKDELSKKKEVYLEKEEEEDLEEKKLTKPEKKEKERIVKGMKKSKSDFEKRYPGRGKSVMYATATKRAKERK